MRQSQQAPERGAGRLSLAQGQAAVVHGIRQANFRTTTVPVPGGKLEVSRDGSDGAAVAGPADTVFEAHSSKHHEIRLKHKQPKR